MTLFQSATSAAALICVASAVDAMGQSTQPTHLAFTGNIAEQRLSLAQLGENIPADWTDYQYLVMELKTSSPQRFGLWVYTDHGLRRLEIQPFGEDTWLRASIPLQYLRGQDQSGNDLASATNRRTNSFWMSVWGPFGDLKAVQSVGFGMEYPINNPTIDIRNVHLARQDEGSVFLDNLKTLDEFGQWAIGDWPGKIKSRQQLDQEHADEQAHFNTKADFGYADSGGYANTQANKTGFFHVEQVNGKWWFVDPAGHLFLSTGLNGTPGGRQGRPGATQPTAGNDSQLTDRRLDSWGMTTGGDGRPRTVMLRWPQDAKTTFLGLPDVYADAFAQGIDAAANRQCTPIKDDPQVLGYFVGNEPPWGGRESEVVDMIQRGPDSATKSKLAEFLAAGDTPKRRKQFVVDAFSHYLDLLCAAVKKYDANHITLGIRFGGNPSDDIMRCGKIFDVCSINVYEYEPTKQVARAYRLTGRPILIGEFHIGVPEHGLGAGLVQAENQQERGIGYRYFVEQAASLDGFVGAHWFTWRDEPVMGRGDGENYNIGFVDVTDRPYTEMVKAAVETNKRLYAVHAGNSAAFSQRPKASEAGTPSSPWDIN